MRAVSAAADSAGNGKAPVSILYIMMPSEYMSVCIEAGLRSICSGAM
jgi:hypothetical protein